MTADPGEPTRGWVGLLGDPYRLILLAPVLFILHVGEEAPGFVAWFNAHVEPPITEELFLGVNLTGLVITVAVTALMSWSRDRAMAALAVAWLSFLMFANGLFHLLATLVEASYAPGVVTATFLYLPYFVTFGLQLLRRREISGLAALGAVLVGATPMVVHGYLILFEGSRLF